MAYKEITLNLKLQQKLGDQGASMTLGPIQ